MLNNDLLSRLNFMDFAGGTNTMRVSCVNVLLDLPGFQNLVGLHVSCVYYLVFNGHMEPSVDFHGLW